MPAVAHAVSSSRLARSGVERCRRRRKLLSSPGQVLVISVATCALQYGGADATIAVGNRYDLTADRHAA